MLKLRSRYRAFRRFGQAKFAYGGPVLGSSQFLLLPQLPQKITLVSKVVKMGSKIQSNSVITNSMGPSIFVRYNRDIGITVKVYLVKVIIWDQKFSNILYVINVNSL